MAVFGKKAQTYAAFQYPGKSDYQSRISIYTTDGYRLYILFYDDDASLPSNSYNNKTGVTYEHASRYRAYLDLLRNEDPVWVTFNEEAKCSSSMRRTNPSARAKCWRPPDGGKSGRIGNARQLGRHIPFRSPSNGARRD